MDVIDVISPLGEAYSILAGSLNGKRRFGRCVFRAMPITVPG